MSDLEYDRKYHHRIMHPVAKRVVVHYVKINGVEHRFDELLGYVEGLKHATADHPMNIYNQAIADQFVGDKMVEVQSADVNGHQLNKLVLVNEAARAEFETELRALEFKQPEAE